MSRLALLLPQIPGLLRQGSLINAIDGSWLQIAQGLQEEEPSPEPQETFYASNLEIERMAEPLPRTPLENLKFGTEFSDHVLHVEHAVGQGWGTPKILPFGFIPVHPAAQVFHYGMSCFEGMKAYRGADGRGYLFRYASSELIARTSKVCRPEMNMLRLLRSSQRLDLAPFDPKELLGCLKALVRLDDSWLPNKEGYSLYLRPFVFASSFSLGIFPPSRTTLSIVCSPVGPYFADGLTNIRLLLNETYARAWPGGVGAHKVASNYGPTIVPQKEAARAFGAQQVLYSLPRGMKPDNATISEAGAMNMFFLLEKRDGSGLELVTPPLDGTILPGVTRDSILQLVGSWGGYQISERQISIGEIHQADREGRLVEMFGSRTAFIVQPVSELVRSSGQVFTAACDDSRGSLAHRLHAALSDIHYARVPSPWSVPIT